MAKEITILIGGAAGQGIQTIGALLARVCNRSGKFIFSYDDFESRIRGGHSFHLLRISDRPVNTVNLRPDILVALDGSAWENHREKVTQTGIVLVGTDRDDTDVSNVFHVPLKQLAESAGGRIASNTVAAGAVLSVIGAPLKNFEEVLSEQFRSKGTDVLNLNIEAGRKGYEAGREMPFRDRLDFDDDHHENLVMTGAQAAALGAISSDCRVFPFYPMSPGTGIMSSAAAYADRLPIVVEQAEDEIAAVNMAIGASFAGVRAMTATSGGGFCLMTEGLGLAAISETPLVIIDAQRPGPATGLATRTAQADLLFAVNASQDEFPRFIFAPGTVLDVFNKVKKAFMLSEKYQVPAIVLMDQYMTDSARTEPDTFSIGNEHESFLAKETDMYHDAPYLRYSHTETGISPRHIPCRSGALVRATGNEHTPEGLSSEDPDNRSHMVEKRLKKTDGMAEEMAMPSVFCEESKFFLTGWGSSKGSIMEACLYLREQGKDVGWIIFEDIWPLDTQKLKAVLKNKKLIMVEGNATCQLGRLIRQLTGIDYTSSVLKYDGRPMYPEYITQKIEDIIG